MKNIVIKNIEGIRLHMPKLVADNWPILLLDEFPNFCGAGTGLGEVAVPDTMYGVSVRHVCFIHDCMFNLMSPDKDNWHYANDIMLMNNLATIRVMSNTFMRPFRSFRALNYYGAVESGFGWKAFTNRRWIENYDPYQDSELAKVFAKVGVKQLLRKE